METRSVISPRTRKRLEGKRGYKPQPEPKQKKVLVDVEGFSPQEELVILHLSDITDTRTDREFCIEEHVPFDRLQKIARKKKIMAEVKLRATQAIPHARQVLVKSLYKQAKAGNAQAAKMFDTFTVGVEPERGETLEDRFSSLSDEELDQEIKVRLDLLSKRGEGSKWRLARKSATL